MPVDVRVIARVLSFALLVLPGLPSVAHAFCRSTTKAPPPDHDPARDGCFTEGALLFWKSACAGYSIHRGASRRVSLEDATRVIDASFATWTAATCPSSGKAPGITLANLGAVDCAEARYNAAAANQNIVVFRDDAWPYQGPGTALALTTLTFNKETGELYDADMEINAFDKAVTMSGDFLPGTFDLQSVVTHEAGHFLGLAHTSDAGAQMFADYRPIRLLGADDVMGLCSIYPDSEVRVVSPQPAPTCTWCPPSAPGRTELVSSGVCDPVPRRGLTTTCVPEARREPPGCSAARTLRPPRVAPAMVLGLASLCWLRRRWRSARG